ncbi:hypothetical protein [Cellvibrio sp. PSBB006]|uniref:hypothetical protein n=1 Tax=Cellvibrio sp. PSBB006 TaxID=1987723 RepID=UPI000B3B8905|nr:hypothetical protein [Cellvibrio sp. PSBB006]ARU29439.1 hypothetical protein CBR65_19460 [Cellvibrio sp. PSBB006]
MEKSIADQVLEIMRKEAPSHLTRQMEEAVPRLQSDDVNVRDAVSKEINGMCNVKALGDLDVKSVSWKEWLGLLEKLNKYSKRKINS